MEAQRSRRDVRPGLAYRAEPARSGATLWKAPLAVIAGGTMSSASFKRAAAASEFTLRPILFSLAFGRDDLHFSRRKGISLASFSSHGNSALDNSHGTGSFFASSQKY